MTKSLPEALKQLANYRIKNSRESQRIFELGEVVLKSGKWTQGDDGDSYTWLEQLALAAIDVGRLDVADQCIATISEKFPGSPRVDCLNGIRIEASQPPEAALKYYDDLLQADESNAAAWKRQIAVLRRIGKTDLAVKELSSCLDTYYTDVEGWLELADVYSSCNQYDHALQSLQHALLLAPQNPFYVLQAAETAYTLGDIPLAIKMFLNVVDMTTSDEDEKAEDSVPDGITVRAWFGVKQCTRKLLLSDSRGSSASQVTAPSAEHLALLDELSTERLLTAYSTSTSVSGLGKGSVSGREVLVRWLEGN